MTNKQGILIGALGSYFNELIAENLRPIVERIDSVAAFTRMTNELLNGDIEERISTLDQRLDELEKRLAKLEEKLDADFAWGRQAIHKIEELSELEVRTVRGIAQEEIRKHLDSDQFPEHAANLVFEKLGGMGLGINQLSIYIESDQFRRRIFDIVDMALQQATLSIKGSE
jgi:hypothetical protein